MLVSFKDAVCKKYGSMFQTKTFYYTKTPTIIWSQLIKHKVKYTA